MLNVICCSLLEVAVQILAPHVQILLQMLQLCAFSIIVVLFLFNNSKFDPTSSQLY